MKRILFFGDSNTYGWKADGSRYSDSIRFPGVVKKLLGEKALVFEDGLPGRSAQEAALSNSVGKAIRRARPDLLVIMLGTNDCMKWCTPSVQKIEGVLDSIIDQARKEMPDIKILLVSPPPLDINHTWKDSFTPEGTKLTEKLSDSIRHVSRKRDTDFFDAGALSHLEDGVHMDASSHQFLGKALSSKIEGLI